jgi:hypothetical protein
LNARRLLAKAQAFNGPPEKTGFASNMRFDPGFELAIDGTDRQIVLQRLERLLDLDQVRIEPPWMASIVAHDNGARQKERDEV